MRSTLCAALWRMCARRCDASVGQALTLPPLNLCSFAFSVLRSVLFGNKLTGTIPAVLGTLPDLSLLYAHHFFIAHACCVELACLLPSITNCAPALLQTGSLHSLFDKNSFCGTFFKANVDNSAREAGTTTIFPACSSVPSNNKRNGLLNALGKSNMGKSRGRPLI